MSNAINKNIILVCTHKDFNYKFPNIYHPIIGGADFNKLNLDVLKDNTGKDNISSKNPYYSELTTLYWGWKHLQYNHLGIVHYRRYFKGKDIAYINNKKIKVISNKEIDSLFTDYDVIVPKKRKYYIETLYNHYCRTLRSEPIIILEKVIKDKYPEYIVEFNKLKKRRSAHMFNMIIAKKEFYDKALPWLFDILDNIYKQLDMHDWNKYEKRALGSVSELLLDIYLSHNNIRFKEWGYIELIAFAKLRKAINYLMMKFFHRRYKGRMK